VDATFSNGDGSVHLGEMSPGVYEGTWTPRNPGEPSTGLCVITIRAKGSGVKTETTQTVKILAPEELIIEITEPSDGTKISQLEGGTESTLFGVQPVRVTVSDDAGSEIKPGEVEIMGDVEITKPDNTETTQSLAEWVSEGNGEFRCDWTPECAGEYTITVKALDATPLNRESATDSVTGTLEAALKIILKASKDGYASVKQELENEENVGQLEISGNVTDESTGEPIEGAKIEIVEGADPASTTTSSDGTYSITAYTPGGSGSDTMEDVNFELPPAEYIVGVYEITSEVFELIEENNGTVMDQCQYEDGPRALLVKILNEEDIVSF